MPGQRDLQDILDIALNILRQASSLRHAFESLGERAVFITGEMHDAPGVEWLFFRATHPVDHMKERLQR